MERNKSKTILHFIILGVLLNSFDVFACFAKKPIKNLDYLDESIYQITDDCFSYSKINNKLSMSSMTNDIQDYERLSENTKFLIDRFIILKCLKSEGNCLFKEEAERCMFTNYKLDKDFLERYVLISKEKSNLNKLPDFEIRSCFQFEDLQDYVISNIKSTSAFHKKLQSKLKFKLVSKAKGNLEYCKEVRSGNRLSQIAKPKLETEPLLITDIRESWDLVLFNGGKEEKVLRDDIAYVINTDGNKYPLVSKAENGTYQILFKGKKYFIKQKIEGATSLFQHLQGMHLYISTGATGNCFNAIGSSKCDISQLGGHFIAEDFKFIDNKLHVLSIPFNTNEETTNCETKKFDVDDSVWIQYFKNSEFQQNLHRLGC